MEAQALREGYDTRQGFPLTQGFFLPLASSILLSPVPQLKPASVSEELTSFNTLREEAVLDPQGPP